MRILLFAALLTLACPPHRRQPLCTRTCKTWCRRPTGIVAGTVTDVQARYGRTENIYTLVKLQDLQVLAGSYKGSEFYVRLLGGEVQGDVLDVKGSPQFAVGDQVVLFLQGNGKQIVPIVGWSQGVFRIENLAGRQIVTDSDGNQSWVSLTTQSSRDPHSIPGGHHRRRTTGGQSRSSWLIDGHRPLRTAARQCRPGGRRDRGRRHPGAGAAGGRADPREVLHRHKSKARGRTRAALQTAEVATFAEDAGPTQSAPPVGSQPQTAPEETGGAFLPKRQQMPDPAADE